MSAVPDPSPQPAPSLTDPRGVPAPPGGAPPPLPPLHVAFPASVALATAVLAFYLLEVALGGPSEAVLRRLGAVRHDLAIEHGEYFRFFCAAFLHGGLLHLALNGLALIQLAPLVELLWGSPRLLAVYLLSALGGTVLSALFQPLPSVGASGAILGLAGLLIGATWIAREPFRTRLRQVLGRRLLFAVALTFVLGVALQVLWLPIVDNFGHLGGFLVGLASSAFLRDPEAPPGRASRTLAGALSALCLGAFAWMALVSRPVDPLDDLVQVHASLQREAPDHPIAQALTIELARSLSDAGRHDDARAALLRRLEGAPDDASALMRLATSFRLHGAPPPDALARARTLADRAAARTDDADRDPLERVLLLDAAGDLHALAGDARAAAAADEEALALLERLAAERPDDPDVLNAHAWMLLTRHEVAARDPARAERLARRAVDLLEGSIARFTEEGRRDLAMKLDTLAEALRQLGRLDEALAFQRRAVTMARHAGLGGDDLIELVRRQAQIEAQLRQARG